MKYIGVENDFRINFSCEWSPKKATIDNIPNVTTEKNLNDDQLKEHVEQNFYLCIENRYYWHG